MKRQLEQISHSDTRIDSMNLPQALQFSFLSLSCISVLFLNEEEKLEDS